MFIQALGSVLYVVDHLHVPIRDSTFLNGTDQFRTTASINRYGIVLMPSVNGLYGLLTAAFLKTIHLYFLILTLVT